jgi:ethylbenzene dioxygenase subunit beta
MSPNDSPDHTPVALVPADEARAVEAFLYREARLLDDNDYDGWIGMMHPDIRYWMPLIQSRHKKDKALRYDPDRMAHFDETLETLKLRASRFNQKTAWAEDPPTRHCHFVTNIEVEAGEHANQWLAHSLVISLRNRNEDEECWLGGRRSDIICRDETGALKLLRRHIFMAQSVLLSKNLNTFF